MELGIHNVWTPPVSRDDTKQKKKQQHSNTALKYSTPRGLLTGYSAPTPWYTSTTQHVCALIFVSLSPTYVHSNSQLLPNYPRNTYGRQCAEWEKTSHNLAWYQEYIQKNVRKIHAQAWMSESLTGIIKYTARSQGFFILVYQKDGYRTVKTDDTGMRLITTFRPTTDHKIILQYNIIIL